MSQQDKPNTAKQEGVGEYSVWWSKDNPTRQCTTHHNACNCREEKFQKLEASLKNSVPMDVVTKLLRALEKCRDESGQAWIQYTSNKAIGEFEQWQKGRGGRLR